ncbi:MAG: serine dehydratase, partial [Chloroflexi bacterium]|nr:serine dehydratase [Chloroflexota bacterium]
MLEKTLKPLRGLREIYRIGMGPSSSHSMGPRRAAELFRDKHPGVGDSFRATLYGSLAATGKGHLTDLAVREAFQPKECKIIWRAQTFLPEHPNGLKLEALSSDGKISASWTVFSTGGGELTDESGIVGGGPVAEYPFQTMDELMQICANQELPVWAVVERHETDLWPWLGDIWDAMQECLRSGIVRDGILPGPLKVKRRAPEKLAKALEMKGALREMGIICAYALAVIEENAAGGTIVTAPTCGSAGVIPGLLYYLQEHEGVERNPILRALATAGIVGALI